MLKTATIAEAGGPELQDCVAIIEQSGLAIAIVADGSGGMSGAAEASRKVVEFVRAASAKLLGQDPVECVKLMVEIDRAIEGDPLAGETTAVIAVVGGAEIVGASVGDSEAWLIGSERCERLTKGQQRKPLLGSGVAVPVPFHAPFPSGTLLVASDGLIKYTSPENICAAAMEADLHSAAKSLIKLVRYASGALPDDVGIALCRRV